MRHPLPRATLLLVIEFSILLGCARSEDRPAEISTRVLEKVAGKWNTRATNEAGVVMGEAELFATADTTGWTLTFPKQKPIPLRVITVAEDSIVTEAGPYESVNLKGAQIRTRAVNRFQDGKLVGTIEGRITSGGRDSVFHLRLEGTRQP